MKRKNTCWIRYWKGKWQEIQLIDRERIDCKPNWLMGIEGDVVSCLYENAIWKSLHLLSVSSPTISCSWVTCLSTSSEFTFCRIITWKEKEKRSNQTVPLGVNQKRRVGNSQTGHRMWQPNAWKLWALTPSSTGKRSMSWVNSVLRQFLTNGPSIYSLFSSKLPGFTTALFQRKPGKVNYEKKDHGKTESTVMRQD